MNPKKVKPKKGEMSINMIIMVVIAIIILVIIVFLIAKSGKSANESTSCGFSGGICKTEACTAKLGDNGAQLSCPNVGETCCNVIG